MQIGDREGRPGRRSRRAAARLQARKAGADAGGPRLGRGQERLPGRRAQAAEEARRRRTPRRATPRTTRRQPTSRRRRPAEKARAGRAGQAACRIRPDQRHRHRRHRHADRPVLGRRARVPRPAGGDAQRAERRLRAGRAREPVGLRRADRAARPRRRRPAVQARQQAAPRRRAPLPREGAGADRQAQGGEGPARPSSRRPATAPTSS